MVVTESVLSPQRDDALHRVRGFSLTPRPTRRALLWCVPALWTQVHQPRLDLGNVVVFFSVRWHLWAHLNTHKEVDFHRLNVKFETIQGNWIVEIVYCDSQVRPLAGHLCSVMRPPSAAQITEVRLSPGGTGGGGEDHGSVIWCLQKCGFIFIYLFLNKGTYVVSGWINYWRQQKPTNWSFCDVGEFLKPYVWTRAKVWKGAYALTF